MQCVLLRWLNRVGVGHLSTGMTNAAKFQHLLNALMDKADLTLGSKLKTNVRNSHWEQC